MVFTNVRSYSRGNGLPAPLLPCLFPVVVSHLFRLIKGAEQCLSFVKTFKIFSRRIGVSDDSAARLNIGTSIFDNHRPQGDSCFLVTGVTEVAHGSCVDATLFFF